VLPVFIRALRKTLPSFLAGLSASTWGVITAANRSAAVLSQSLTTPFADPLAGLKDRNLRDVESYTEKNFAGQSFQILLCFIFRSSKCFPLASAPERRYSRANTPQSVSQNIREEILDKVF
jgi:hypothetical protein